MARLKSYVLLRTPEVQNTPLPDYPRKMDIKVISGEDVIKGDS